MTIGILHTTESSPGTGAAVTAYLQRIGAEPHYVVDPSDGYFLQLLPLTASGKALRNLAGGVETNRRTDQDGDARLYPVQVEIVGRAAEVGGYSDEWYAVLRDQLQRISAEANVPYEFHTSPTRLSPEAWAAPWLPHKWYGHCNVPENDHWDPGTLDYTRLTPAYVPEPEVQLSDPVSLRKHDPETAVFSHEEPSTVGGALVFGHAEAQQANYRIELLRQEVASLKNLVQALVTVQQSTTANQAPATLNYDLLAGIVVDKISARLAGRQV